MRKTVLVLALVIIAALALNACVSVPAERSVKTYNTEHRAANDALAEARERGADEECPARYMAAAWKRNDAVDVFWSCRTAQAIKMMQEATEMAEALCDGEAKEKMEEPAPMAEPMKPAPAPMKPAPAPMKPAPAPMKPEPMAEKTWVIEDVNFDFDSAAIKPGYREQLSDAVKMMKENPELSFEIHGYTDSIGTEAYNQGLSERRAAAVKRYLADHGIDASRLKTAGHGESNPVAANDTRAGRAKNRRVEIKPVK